MLYTHHIFVFNFYVRQFLFYADKQIYTTICVCLFEWPCERMSDEREDRERGEKENKEIQTSKYKCLKQDDNFINNIVENDMKCVPSRRYVAIWHGLNSLKWKKNAKSLDILCTINREKNEKECDSGRISKWVAAAAIPWWIVWKRSNREMTVSGVCACVCGMVMICGVVGILSGCFFSFSLC